jgi:osmoprotectant transport system ATP-binding protein
VNAQTRADANAALLSLEGVSVRYGERRVLQDLHLAVAEGERAALLGASGCGKSTVLRLILGLIQPESGAVYFRGAALADCNLNAIRREIGYMTQQGDLFPHLTIAENAALAARNFGRERAWIDVRTNELSELARLSRAELSRYPHEVSGGQRQRAALMRALFLDPPVILLDEPLGALDMLTRDDLHRELDAIFRVLNKTVLLVTHDPREAALLCDRIHILDAGKTLQTGSAAQLRAQPANAFVARLFPADVSAGTGL